MQNSIVNPLIDWSFKVVFFFLKLYICLQAIWFLSTYIVFPCYLLLSFYEGDVYTSAQFGQTLKRISDNLSDYPLGYIAVLKDMLRILGSSVPLGDAFGAAISRTSAEVFGEYFQLFLGLFRGESMTFREFLASLLPSTITIVVAQLFITMFCRLNQFLCKAFKDGIALKLMLQLAITIFSILSFFIASTILATLRVLVLLIFPGNNLLVILFSLLLAVVCLLLRGHLLSHKDSQKKSAPWVTTFVLKNLVQGVLFGAINSFFVWCVCHTAGSIFTMFHLYPIPLTFLLCFLLFCIWFLVSAENA